MGHLSCVYDLFAGNCTPDDVLAIGKKDGKRGRFYSHLYIGLYYEAAADVERSTESSSSRLRLATLSRSRYYILKAVNEYKLDDYMWHLAYVHQKLRGWN